MVVLPYPELAGGWLGEAAMRLLGLTQKSPCLQGGNELFSGSRARELSKGPRGSQGPGRTKLWT